MTGTVLLAGDHARISLQMLDASTGVTLVCTLTGWCESGTAQVAERSYEAIRVSGGIEGEPTMIYPKPRRPTHR